MARLRSGHSAGRQPVVHFSTSKMADPFIIANTNMDTTSSPHDRVTNTSSIFRSPQAMLSELVHHERAKTRLSSKRTPPRDVPAPKHAGISKSGRRTPLSARSDRNAKVLSKSIGSSGKRSTKRRERRTSTMRPDHPLFRRYEAAIANYQKHISTDLPAKFDKAKQSINNHFSYILKATETLPDQIKASAETLFVPLSETALAINIAATGQTYSQPLGKRFEDFQAVVQKQRENLGRLETQHENVVARLGALKRTILAGVNAVGVVSEDEGGNLSYAEKAREIQKRFQVEREKVLKKFQVDKDTLLGRINSYEANRKKQKMEADKMMRMYQDTLARLLNEEDGMEDDD